MFDLYGEMIRCQRAASFRIIAFKSVLGSIAVGMCDKETKRIQDAARDAKRELSETLNDIARSIPQPESLKSTEWEWTHKDNGDGWEVFSFPVIAIGHGILWASTVVLSNTGAHRAIIVQADLGSLCDPSSTIRTQIKTPLSEAATQTLIDIGLAFQR